MPKQKVPSSSQTNALDNARDNNLRHSLQTPKTLQQLSPLRHTKSHNYERKSKLKSSSNLPPSISEEGDSVEIVNEKIQPTITKRNEGDRASKSSEANSRKSSSTSTYKNGCYENAAFEGGTGPVPKQMASSSSRSSMRDPSIHSLTVMREQYCCCSRYSTCEKVLLAAVSVLAVIIIVLVVVVGVLVGGKGVDTNFQWSF